MSCVDNVCGTGLAGINNPKPGDPDNNLSLSANTVYGGINVSWTYPTTNPHAVAHTLLYRGSNSTLAQAVELAKVGGSVFFDALNPVADTTYYYWIKTVSINGTVGAPIGPVSAIAKPRATQTLESLTGLIDDGVLSNALKSDIARIDWVQTLNQLEIDNRIAAHASLANAIAVVQLGVDESLINIQQEITQRQSADSAIVDSVTIMTTAMNDNLAAFLEEKALRTTKDEAYANNFTALYTRTANNEAAISTEQTARTTADSAQAAQLTSLSAIVASNSAAIITEQNARVTLDSAIASQITSIQAAINNNGAAIITEQNARVTADQAAVNSITSLQTNVANNAAAIITEQNARTTAVEAVASSVSTMQAKVNNAAAAIQAETDARVSADKALAAYITTVQTSLDGNISSVQTSLQSQISTTSGKVTEIGALYTAKVTVNNLVGGFGIYNNGIEVDAGFEVSRFWIGSTAQNGVKPFIVDGSTVYIDKARIRNADIDTLKIAGNSVMVGYYDEAGGNSVSGGGSTTLITRSVSLGDNSNSGLIVAATVAVSTSTNCTVGFRVLINGVVAGDQRASLQAGYSYLFPVSGFGYPAGGSGSVQLVAYSPTSGSGANIPFSVGASTMSIMGGKR